MPTAIQTVTLIDENTASMRFNQLLEAVHETAFERCARFTGQVLPVVVEESDRHQSGWVTGRTQYNLLVHFPGGKELIGSCAHVKIEESKGFYLIGRSM